MNLPNRDRGLTLSIARSIVTLMVAALVGFGLVAVTTVPVQADAGDLSEIECIANAGAGSCTGANPASLGQARGVANSPDGSNVYVAGFAGDSITIFSRDSGTGELTQAGCIADGGANGCTDPTLDALDGATGVAASPDGENVYVTASTADSINIFDRDTATGALTQNGCIAINTDDGCVALTNPSLDGAWDVTVSPDGANVYVTSQSPGDSVTVFDRNSTTGSLTEAACIANGGTGGCTDPTYDSLSGARGLAISADGASVYVAAANTGNGAITLFNRNQSTGGLTQGACVADGGAAGCTDPDLDSLGEASNVALFARWRERLFDVV